MVKKFVTLGNRAFHERHISIHSHGKVTQLTLSSRLQAGIVGGVVLASLMYGAGSYWSYTLARVSQRQQAEAVEAVKDQLVDAQQAAAAAEEKLQQLATTSHDDNAVTATDDDSDPNALADRVASRITLLEKELQAATDQQNALKLDRARLAAEKGKLQNKVGELQQVKEKAAESEKEQKTLASERDRLRERVSELEKKLQRISAASSEAGAPKVAEEEDEEASGGAVIEHKETAFNMDAFLAKYGIGMRHTGAMGGPYVALSDKATGSSATLDPTAQELLKSLPITAPLDRYQLESGFGVRVDPINGHRSMHTGLDFSAPYKSPVYCTSAGTVISAGWSGAYGKMVEIDHGHGIHTRYAHLNRLMVNIGQHVSKHAEIGLLGSTGRSTGPHVHYEVIVNGAAQDPQQFLAAGRSITFVKAGD